MTADSAIHAAIAPRIQRATRPPEMPLRGPRSLRLGRRSRSRASSSPSPPSRRPSSALRER